MYIAAMECRERERVHTQSTLTSVRGDRGRNRMQISRMRAKVLASTARSQRNYAPKWARACTGQRGHTDKIGCCHPMHPRIWLRGYHRSAPSSLVWCEDGW